MKQDMKQFVEFLGVLEHLKCNLRHSFTTSGRQESVAEHCWRLTVMAMLLEDEFPDLDMNKVIRMCLVHDWGEAITGDIPAFLKNKEDEAVEDQAVRGLAEVLPEPLQSRMSGLFAELQEGKSGEARLCMALDKIETLIQHNEAGADTWLPLEYDLNMTYGNEQAASFPQTVKLRDFVREMTIDLIRQKEAGDILDKRL